MQAKTLPDAAQEFLRNKEFINIATADFQGRPNVAPKFLLKSEGDCIYLIDHVMGRTFKNIQENTRVSLSTIDLNTLIGYQINGIAVVIEKGREFKKLLKEMQEKQIQFSTRRIIEGVQKEKAHATVELALSQAVVVLKIKVEEIVEIGPSGKLDRRNI